MLTLTLLVRYYPYSNANEKDFVGSLFYKIDNFYEGKKTWVNSRFSRIGKLSNFAYENMKSPILSQPTCNNQFKEKIRGDRHVFFVKGFIVFPWSENIPLHPRQSQLPDILFSDAFDTNFPIKDPIKTYKLGRNHIGVETKLAASLLAAEESRVRGPRNFRILLS